MAGRQGSTGYTKNKEPQTSTGRPGAEITDCKTCQLAILLSFGLPVIWGSPGYNMLPDAVNIGIVHVIRIVTRGAGMASGHVGTTIIY